MRTFAAMISFVLLAGLTTTAVADHHPACVAKSGWTDQAACGATLWQIAAREADRPANAASPGSAESADEKTCAGAGSGGPQDWIMACDRLIASPRLDAARLVEAYRLRGNWHQVMRDHGRAVVDYDEVIKRDPRNARALNSRTASLRAICFGTDEPTVRLTACTRLIGELAALKDDAPAYPVKAGLN